MKMKSVVAAGVFLLSIAATAAPTKPYRAVGFGTDGKCYIVFENWGFGGDLDDETSRYFYADVRTKHDPSVLVHVQTQPGEFREMVGEYNGNRLVVNMTQESVRNVTSYRLSSSNSIASCRLFQR